MSYYSVYLDDPDERCGPGDIGLHGFVTLAAAQGAAEKHSSGPLNWVDADGQRGEVPGRPHDPAYVIYDEGEVPMQQPQATQQPTQGVSLDALQQMIDQAVANQVGQPQTGQPKTFEETLSEVDPTDSEAALAMLDFLLSTGRLGRVGVLDGGQGYLFMYQEPKGTTKAGYRPGATQGDRIVDGALESQRGKGPASEKGLCTGCYSVVRKDGDQIVNDETGDPECSSADGKHVMG